jgi:hypothetical protein
MRALPSDASNGHSFSNERDVRSAFPWLDMTDDYDQLPRHRAPCALPLLFLVG